MPKTKISEFSATPANNTDIDSINIAEGCAPSGINDAIRELMAQLKDFQTGAVGDSFGGPITGAVNATVGATTPNTGAFTTLAASSTLSVTGAGSIQGLTVGRGNGAVATNTAVGASALAAVTGGYNTAFGQTAGSKITSGTENTAIGQGSMSNGAAVTSDYNTGVGTSSLYNLTSGSANTGVGQGALSATSSGSNNTAVGKSALQANTASNNVAAGYQALLANTSGAANVAIGTSALQGNLTASNCTAVGWRAGLGNQTGASNTFIGKDAGYSTTGGFNTFIGTGSAGGSGENITTGTKNTILGSYNGNQNSLDIRTLSNHIVLSDGDGVPRGYFDNNGTYNIANTTGSNIPAIKITQNDSTANRFLRGIQVDQTSTGAGENVSSGALRLTYTGGIGFNNVVENIVINSSNVPGTSQDGYGRKSVTTLPASSSSSDFNNNYFQNYSSLNLNGYLSNTGASAFRTGFYAHYVGTTTPASTNQNVYGVFISNGGTISDGYVFGVYQSGSSRNYFEGKMYMPAVYSNTVGGTNRDVFVDNNGLVGYVSSTRASKKNITSITDASWLLQLNPVAFNRRVKENGVYTEETYSELEYGLIAEEAETVNAELCFYDDVKVEQPEGYEGEDQFNKELRGVHYNKLIVPLLKIVQELKAEFDAYKASHP